MDDNIPHHPKFLKAGPIASWLWVCGNCYCNRYLTDGFIADEVLSTLGAIPNVSRYATKLVLARLWDAVDSGYQVHDFHDHNPRAVDVKAKREADRIRKKNGEESTRNPRGIQAESEIIPELPAPAIPIPSHPNTEKIKIKSVSSERLDVASEPSSRGTFPTKQGRWTLSEAQYGHWRALYPQSLDILSELSKARAWLEANPAKRKTARGMPRFFVNWLNSAAAGTSSVPRHLPQQTSQRTSWIADCQARHGGACETSAAHWRKKNGL